MSEWVETPAHRVESARRIADRLVRAGSVAVSTHVGGDGDGWGSACALAYHLAPLGVDVHLLAATPIPERFSFLLPTAAGTLEGEAGVEALRTAEVHAVVDASEAARLGKFGPHFLPQKTVVIDHHPVATARIEAALSLIDPTAAATAELVYDVLRQTGQSIGADAARSLYVGLVTDTGSFRYSNSTPHAHRLAASLIEAGADPARLYRWLFAIQTPEELATLQVALERLQRDEELGITWTVLPADVAGRLGALEEYEEVIEHLRNLRGTEVALLFRELEDGQVKVSFRSTGEADVAELARSFGGGGHEKAAGATVDGELSEVVSRVVRSARSLLGGSARGET